MRKKSSCEGGSAYCYLKQRGRRGNIIYVLNLEVNDNFNETKMPSLAKDLYLDISIVIKHVVFQSSKKKSNGFVFYR